MQIITNNKPRPMLALCELPPAAAKDFDYVLPDDGSCRFVKYKGAWLDCFDMQSISREQGLSQFSGWHGIDSDTDILPCSQFARSSRQLRVELFIIGKPANRFRQFIHIPAGINQCVDVRACSIRRSDTANAI